jgi:hypothetical protein
MRHPILNCIEGATLLLPDGDMVREYFGARIVGTMRSRSPSRRHGLISGAPPQDRATPTLIGWAE